LPDGSEVSSPRCRRPVGIELFPQYSSAAAFSQRLLFAVELTLQLADAAFCRPWPAHDPLALRPWRVWREACKPSRPSTCCGKALVLRNTRSLRVSDQAAAVSITTASFGFCDQVIGQAFVSGHSSILRPWLVCANL